MRKHYKAGVFALSLIVIYFVGLFSGSLISVLNSEGIVQPFSFSGSIERASPGDWIKEDQVKIYNDRVTVILEDATWAKFTNTNSMDPLIDEYSNSIEITPKSESQLQIGDIISYKSKIYSVTVIHRIIDIKEDEEGIYFVVKGDNNVIKDNEKVRFNQIEGVVVGVLY